MDKESTNLLELGGEEITTHNHQHSDLVPTVWGAMRRAQAFEQSVWQPDLSVIMEHQRTAFKKLEELCGREVNSVWDMSLGEPTPDWHIINALRDIEVLINYIKLWSDFLRNDPIFGGDVLAAKRVSVSELDFDSI